MRLVAYCCFAVLVCAAPARAAPGDPPGQPSAPTQPAPMQPTQTYPAPTQPVAANPAPQASAPQPAPPRTAAERRRTRTYARCNRAAYNRSLRGGARRRFLIRCRLGYERGIGQPGQAAPAPQRKP